MKADSEAWGAARRLLLRGLITVPEATRLTGMSRCMICRLVKREREAFERTRNAKLARLWLKEMNNGPRLVQRSKAATDRGGTTRRGQRHGDVGDAQD